MAKSEPTQFSRPVQLRDIPPQGMDFVVTATSAECAELAELLETPALKSLSGRFRLNRQGSLVYVTGQVDAVVTRHCVVTLEPFDEIVSEEVDAAFSQDAEPFPDLAGTDGEELGNVIAAIDLDAPEPIIGSRIDLGQLTMEFLALGMNPYPRKPGVVFDPGDEEEFESPFAALAKRKPSPGD